MNANSTPGRDSTEPAWRRLLKKKRVIVSGSSKLFRSHQVHALHLHPSLWDCGPNWFTVTENDITSTSEHNLCSKR